MKTFLQLLVSGIAVGSLYAFMAVGVVLIYRSTRTLNFAHGMMATAGAFAYAILVDDRGWDVIIAFLAIVVLGAASGLVTYVVVGRPLVRATPLARTIATILWMLAIQGVLLLTIKKVQRSVPALFSHEPVAIAGVALSKQALGVMLFCIVGVGLLYAFFNFTRSGLAMRAVAEVRSSAAIVGIGLLRVDALAWVLGGVTAFTGGALVAPFGIADFQELNLLLVRVLAAALVGGFVGLPGAMVGGLLIGTGEQLLAGYVPGVPEIRELLPFALVMLVVTAESLGLLRRRAEGRSQDDTRVSLVVRGRTRTRRPTSPTRAVWGVALLLSLLIPRLVLGEASSFVLGQGLIYGVVALSLVVVTGLSGQISLAQASLMALGAYVGHYLIVKTDVFGFWTVIPLVAVFGAVAAGALSVLTLRVRGLYLAVVTWTFGLVVDRVILRWNWLVSAGEGGLSGAMDANLSRPTLFGVGLFADTRFVYVLLAFALLAAIIVRNFSSSRSGLALRAQRDDESAAHASGLAVWHLRVIAFMVSGALATVAGFLTLAQQGAVLPIQFNQFLSLNFVLILVLGGTDSWLGALGAGIFYAYAPDIFKATPLGGDWQFVILGILGVFYIAWTEGGHAAAFRSFLQARRRRTDADGIGYFTGDQAAVAGGQTESALIAGAVERRN